MSVVAIFIASLGAVLFLLGLVLPFVAGRLDHAREPVRDVPDLGSRPSVEVVIAAYLEAGLIGATVERLEHQLLGWPGAATITVVASDEATARAAEAAGAHVVRTEPEGKASAINAGVRLSSADVILLTDANCELSPDNWPGLLLDALASADLVSARKREKGARESAFWRYEDAIKRSGADQKPTMSVAGEFLAFRRADFQPIPSGFILDDLWVAKDFATRGMRVRIAAGVETDEESAEGKDQWERRTRIAAGLWVEAIPEWRSLLRIPAGRQFLAHKVYRMTIGAVGFWMAAVGTAFAFAPWGLIVVPLLVAAAVLYYSFGPASIVTPIATLVTLQVVPFLALGRASRVRRERRAGVASAAWKKIAR